MNPRVVIVLLLLLGAAIAQDSTPILLSGKDHPPICRGKDSDAPGCITAPHATYSPEPDYPEKELEARHQGTVILSLVVDSQGLPRDVVVSHTLTPKLDKAATDTVKKWKFSPATKDGKPVATKIDVEVAFRLR